jgi:formylmethanofuran dehydrogenase subunit C
VLTLTLQASSPIPLELDGITPDRIHTLSAIEVARLSVYHGNRTEPLGTFFDVTGSPSDGNLTIRGDTRHVKGIGAGMASGRIVASVAGTHAGAKMTGGELEIDESAGDWLGAEIKRGAITVHGNAGNQAGAAYRGSRRGMTGGTILIHGSAGDECGLLMRRGLIAVKGGCGEFAGASMIAGSLFVFGQSGNRLGAGMKRGTILAAGGVNEFPPSFRYSCAYRPDFLDIYLRYLSIANFTAERVNLGILSCYRGDLLTGGRGEVLITNQ